jgi:hypothetical protein
MQLSIGGVVAVPWDWTDLPIPQTEEGPSSDRGLTTLLSPIALRDLVRFLRGRCRKAKNKKHSND